MAIYTCVNKIKNNRNITQLYHLIDINNPKNEIVISHEELKGLMLMKSIHINNLKLTSDYKIINAK